MARVDIRLNGRLYPIACDDGQEDRVREVAAYVDSRLEEIKGLAQGATDTHLLVMVSLMVADELMDRSAEAEGLRGHLARTGEAGANGSSGGTGTGTEDAAVAEAIGRLANRVEDVARRLSET